MKILENRLKETIYKTLKEAFDFGDLEVETTAAGQLNDSPDTMREFVLKDTPMDKVFLSVFNVNVPAGFKNCEEVPGFGYVWFRGEGLAYNKREVGHILNRRADMMKKDETPLIAAGFTSHSILRNDEIGPIVADSIGNIPTWLPKLLKALGTDISAARCGGTYFVSPDNGVIVLKYLRFDDYSTGRCRGRTFKPMIFYTGEVIYDIDKKKAKANQGMLRVIKKMKQFLKNERFQDTSYCYKYLKACNIEPKMLPDNTPVFYPKPTEYKSNISYTIDNLDLFTKDFSDQESDNSALCIILGKIKYNPYMKKMWKIDQGSYFNPEKHELKVSYTSQNGVRIFLSSDPDAFKDELPDEILNDMGTFGLFSYVQYGVPQLICQFRAYTTFTGKIKEVFDKYMFNKLSNKDLYFNNFDK